MYITHIKEFLIPHASGMTARELIKRQLDELEQDLRLGVSFVIVSPGDRLCGCEARRADRSDIVLDVCWMCDVRPLLHTLKTQIRVASRCIS